VVTTTEVVVPRAAAATAQAVRAGGPAAGAGIMMMAGNGGDKPPPSSPQPSGGPAPKSQGGSSSTEPKGQASAPNAPGAAAPAAAPEESAQAASEIAGIPGRVATRINLSNAGMKHVLDFHLNPAKAINKSQFFGSEATVRGLLSAKSTVQAPVRLLESGNFARTVTAAGPVGTLPGKLGGGATNVFTVISDQAGNLLSAFPGRI
jgi:hypothetical protein